MNGKEVSQTVEKTVVQLSLMGMFELGVAVLLIIIILQNAGQEKRIKDMAESNEADDSNVAVSVQVRNEAMRLIADKVGVPEEEMDRILNKDPLMSRMEKRRKRGRSAP